MGRDVDRTYRLERENRQMRDRMEVLERDYEKLKKALKTIMPVLQEKMEELDRRIGRLCPSQESSVPSC